MKKNIGLLLICIAFVSCYAVKQRRSEMKEMMLLLERNNIDYATLKDMLSEDKQCSYNLLKKGNISCASLQKMLSGTSNGKDSLCTHCPEVTFCNITLKELTQNVQNYRDYVWSQTSNFPISYNLANLSTDYRNFAQSGITPTSWGSGDVDAQFMDVSIDDMKNYLCVIQNSIIPFNIHPNTLRFYYTRYDANTAGTVPTYNKKHSLCVVPVEKDPSNLTLINGEVLYDVQFNLDSIPLIWNLTREGCGSNTSMFNRNVICPPNHGCLTNTLLSNL